MTFYLTANTTHTKKGERVTVYLKPHPNVWLVENDRGVRHSVSVVILSEVPVVETIVQIIEEPNLFNSL